MSEIICSRCKVTIQTDGTLLSANAAPSCLETVDAGIIHVSCAVSTDAIVAVYGDDEWPDTIE